MIELAKTLLPNLPVELSWVYGVMYIIMTITFFALLLSPFLMVFNVRRKKW